MHADVQPGAPAGQAHATREHIRVTLLFGLIVVSILAITWPIIQGMADTWKNSSTYGHCYLVIPVAIWMVWRKSASLASAPLIPFLPGLAVVAAVGFVGLLGELASAAVVTQFAAVGMVAATALTVLGRRWTCHLAFPLGFLFFAVPFGEGLLPVLMEWTATVTVWALRATGIAVYREGNYFVVPSGSWSVIEACGGVRFLIAALVTGCIFAWLQYRAPLKRLVFVSLALIAALFANWLRAYGMVLIGHLSDNRIEIARYHSAWGWLIFGAVMFGLFAFAMRWSDKEIATWSPAQVNGETTAGDRSIATALIASLLTIAAWPAAASWIESHADVNPLQIEAIAPREGWQPAPTAAGDWKPELVAPSAVDVQTFVLNEHVVSIYRGIYGSQRQGSELVNAMNRIAGTDSGSWRVIESGTAEIELNGVPTLIRSAVVRGAVGQFLVWHWYQLSGLATASDFRVKARLAVLRLTGASDAGVWVAIYTPVRDDINAGGRRLNEFVGAMSQSINTALETTINR